MSLMPHRARLAASPTVIQGLDRAGLCVVRTRVAVAAGSYASHVASLSCSLIEVCSSTEPLLNDECHSEWTSVPYE